MPVSARRGDCQMSQAVDAIGHLTSFQESNAALIMDLLVYVQCCCNLKVGLYPAESLASLLSWCNIADDHCVKRGHVLQDQTAAENAAMWGLIVAVLRNLPNSQRTEVVERLLHGRRSHEVDCFVCMRA